LADKFFLLVEIETISLVGSAPQEAGHLLEFRPATKGVVGRVNEYHVSTAAHVVDEVPLHRIGPHLAIVVAQDDVVVLELR
jgi:hypothetical protein